MFPKCVRYTLIAVALVAGGMLVVTLLLPGEPAAEGEIARTVSTWPPMLAILGAWVLAMWGLRYLLRRARAARMSSGGQERK